MYDYRYLFIEKVAQEYATRKKTVSPVTYSAIAGGIIGGGLGTMGGARYGKGFFGRTKWASIGGILGATGGGIIGGLLGQEIQKKFGHEKIAGIPRQVQPFKKPNLFEKVWSKIMKNPDPKDLDKRYVVGRMQRTKQIKKPYEISYESLPGHKERRIEYISSQASKIAI